MVSFFEEGGAEVGGVGDGDAVPGSAAGNGLEGDEGLHCYCEDEEDEEDCEESGVKRSGSYGSSGRGLHYGSVESRFDGGSRYDLIAAFTIVVSLSRGVSMHSEGSSCFVYTCCSQPFRRCEISSIITLCPDAHDYDIQSSLQVPDCPIYLLEQFLARDSLLGPPA